MTMSPTPRWSFDVSQADWVKERLNDLMTGTVSSIVPAGFDAYARILHPVETPLHGDRLVRWRDVANWGGHVLTAQSQWLTVAMPEVQPKHPRPWRSQGPDLGSLYPDDARALTEIAGRFTDTPQRCWCCIWEGFGWWSRSWLLPPGQLATSPPPSPVPIEAKDWPKVHTRYRDYFLYEESLETSFVEAIEILEGHSPNLWWPSDHAWCVATEIDFDSTYVGGSKPFIDAILQSEELEAFEVGSTDTTSADLSEWMVLLSSALSTNCSQPDAQKLRHRWGGFSSRWIVRAVCTGGSFDTRSTTMAFEAVLVDHPLVKAQVRTCVANLSSKSRAA